MLRADSARGDVASAHLALMAFFFVTASAEEAKQVGLGFRPVSAHAAFRRSLSGLPVASVDVVEFELVRSLLRAEAALAAQALDELDSRALGPLSLTESHLEKQLLHLPTNPLQATFAAPSPHSAGGSETE